MKIRIIKESSDLVLEKYSRARLRRQMYLLKRLNRGSGQNITIKDIQTNLANLGDKYKNILSRGGKINPVDGKYGPATYAAIVQFQKDFRSELGDGRVDGLVGPNTLGVLNTKSKAMKKQADVKGVTVKGSAEQLADLDTIAKAKPGQKRIEAMIRLARKKPKQFSQFKNSILADLSKRTKGDLALTKSDLAIVLGQNWESMPQRAKDYILKNQEDRKISMNIKNKLSRLYQDFRAAENAAKKMKSEDEASNLDDLKKNAAKYGLKNLTQIGIVDSYMKQGMSREQAIQKMRQETK